MALMQKLSFANIKNGSDMRLIEIVKLMYKERKVDECDCKVNKKINRFEKMWDR